MKKILIIQATAIIGLMMLSLPAMSKVFVDWRGGFHVTYPDDWRVVSYSEVSEFLENQGLSVISLDYDAVLAENQSRPFYTGAYIFLVVHEVGALSPRQIDSTLKATATEQVLEISEGAVTGGMALSPGKLVFDRGQKIAAIYSQIRTDVTDKSYLELRKFYEKGVALFLCYAPREQFEAINPAFYHLLESFSTRDLEKAAPKEELKVVDVTTREQLAAPEQNETRPEPDNEISTKFADNKTIYILILAGLFAGIILIIRLKKKMTRPDSDK